MYPNISNIPNIPNIPNISNISNISKKNNEYFYNLLNSTNEDDIILSSNSNNRCEITNDNLEDNYIELICGHKFNYIPLFNEIKYQKTNKYSISYDFTKLSINQIKCPYCRSISNNILPYFKYYNLPMLKGVNYPYKYSMKLNSCQYCLKNSNNYCNKSACITPNGIYCNRHYEQSLKQNNNNILQRMKIKELKDILRKNKCRVGGNKQTLIDRIDYEKKNNENWID